MNFHGYFAGFAISNLVNGLISLSIGVVIILMARGMWPGANAERMELWRRKFGTIAYVAGPLLILFGVLTIFGLFRP